MNVEFVSEYNYLDVIASVDLPMPPRIKECVHVYKEKEEIQLKIISVRYVVQDNDKHKEVGSICICRVLLRKKGEKE